MTSATVIEPKIYNLVAKRMAQMHKLEPTDPDIIKEPMLWKKTEQFMDLMPREFDDPVKQKRWITLFIDFIFTQDYNDELTDKILMLKMMLIRL